MRVAAIVAAFAVFLIILCLIYGCLMFRFIGGYSFPLVGGYELHCPYHGANCISSNRDGGLMILGANVDLYAVTGRLIVGHVSAEQPPSPGNQQEAIGYFVIDNDNGDTQKGMPKKEWILALRKRGIVDLPRLRRPHAPLL